MSKCQRIAPKTSSQVARRPSSKPSLFQSILRSLPIKLWTIHSKIHTKIDSKSWRAEIDSCMIAAISYQINIVKRTRKLGNNSTSFHIWKRVKKKTLSRIRTSSTSRNYTRNHRTTKLAFPISIKRHLNRYMAIINKAKR